MAINFTHYPDSNRVPGIFVEMDPSQANTATTFQRSLLIGQITTTGTATPGHPLQVNSREQINLAAGRGSILANMAMGYLAGDNFGDLWLLPIPDEAAAIAATGTIEITASGARNGTISLYIAGMGVRSNVFDGDAATVIGTRLTAAINALLDLPVTAVWNATDAEITLTAKHKGMLGNQIDIRLNYYGAGGGEATPSGVTLDITPMAGGTVNPLIATALDNLADQNFDFIVTAFTDTPNLDALKVFLDDAQGRWSWEQMLYGGAFAAYRGTYAQCVSFGLARNDQHMSVMPYDGSPDPPWVWAAQMGAFAASSLRVDPGLPLQYMGTQLKAPPVPSRWSIGERNTMLYSGLSSFKVADDGTVVIERMTTTYQKNAAGSVDDAYLDVETMFSLMYVARDLARYLLTKYARKKLVSNETPVLPGSNCVNPLMIKASTVAEYRALEAGGFVQNSRNFARDVVVENAGRGLVKILAPVDVVNQLRQIAVLLQFRKS
jgi:phage tail sheath gpL-like